MIESYADRSRVLCFQGCPRKRYYEYHVPNGTQVSGIRPNRLDMNLLVGSCFHRGVQHLLTGAQAGFGDREFIDPWIDDAVELALAEYWAPVQRAGLILEENEDASYVTYEQAALIEALIRGYAHFVLPQLLDRFTVVEVEREDVASFTRGMYTLNFGARVDALLMEKESLDLYALSLKTAKEWGKRDDASARHDMQGLSETAVVEQRLKGWHEECEGCLKSPVLLQELKSGQFGFDSLHGIPRWFWKRFATGASPTLMGVKMEYALKGRRAEYPPDSGRYTYSNPLIRPWKKADDLKGGGDLYAFKYEFKDPMGGNHRLGKGWNRVNIWEDMGVKAWIELLATRSLQGFEPGAGIAGQFVLPIEYYRNEEDMERWERQVVWQEAKIRQGLQAIAEAPGDESILDEVFPMYTKSCDWPTKCQFQDICFGPKAYLHDPLSVGIYEPRVANHPTELLHISLDSGTNS